MRYLVTGGAGFIGSHLVDRLIATGNKVLVLDDMSTGTLKNLQNVIYSPLFSCRSGSVLDESIVDKAVKHVDIIVHLAASVGVRRILDHPIKTIATNVRGTEIILEAASKYNRKAVVASTSEVYGKSDTLPYSEEDDIMLGSATSSRWGYACSKAIDEFLSLAYYREKILPVVIVRFFNIIGPRQVGRYGMVVPRFVNQAIHNRPITVYGDGTQRRCFMDVSEAVTALLLLLNNPNSIGEIYNIGNNNEVSIKDLAIVVKKLAGSRSRISYVPYKEAYGEDFDDVARRIPDISKLYSATKFKSNMPLENTIANLIALYQERGV